MHCKEAPLGKMSGGAKFAGKLKSALKSLFSATNGGIDIYDIAGSTVVPADVLSGKAEEERRWAEKGKAWVVDEDEERMSVDTSYSAEQNGPGAKERLRRVAALVLDINPTVEEAIDAMVCPAQEQQEHQHQHQQSFTQNFAQGSTASLRRSRAPSLSLDSSSDLEMAVFAFNSSQPGAQPSPSSSAAPWCNDAAGTIDLGAGTSDFGAGPSHFDAGPSYGGAGSSGAGPSGVRPSNSSRELFGGAGPSSSSSAGAWDSDHAGNDGGHIASTVYPRWN